MILVRTSLRPSPVHGLGCFTEEAIAKGQRVWVYDDRIDCRIAADDLPDLPPSIQEFLDVYGYAEVYEGRKVIVLCGDLSKHMNHSADPNLTNDGPDNIAARDIQPGEELTCDYYSFDLDAASKFS